MRERSKVVEILSARGVVFARVESGVCVAFSRGTNQRLCFLNVSGEIIQDIFYNKCDDSIITVSISESDNFSSFKCRSTGIEYIRRAQPNAGFTLFESLSLKRPGFVDFDDLDSNAVTFSVEERGELVTTFEEHHFLNPADSSFNNTIYTTSDEDLIISYGKAETNDQQRNGSINISSILTGKSIAKIDAGNSRMLKECTCSGRRCNSSSHQATEITSTVAQALDDVTALCYDEELNELYTGNQAGLLHVWSS
ncbi:hypothetical protein DCAR_0520670 [Daucus carota subsp. sativus]|uniref:Uncharacterized protein n=1 Tax=Daucus carota subsp. sativus TaxID=79200 RepID=A0A161Y9J3_DAUCS|nr:hypothetical protein DCAR_0520670 [Daucus carota subsp. sativus]